MKIVALLLTMIISVPAFGTCDKHVSKIKEGTTIQANCDLWIVTEPTMQEIMRTDEELEKHKKLQKQMEHLRKLDEQEIEFYKRQSLVNQKALEKSESQKFWIGVGAFTLGVLATGLAAKAAIESTR